MTRSVGEPDGQGEGHKFLEALTGVGEAHGNGAGRQFDARRQPLQILRLQAARLGGRHFNEHGRLLDPFAAGLGQMLTELLPPEVFVIGLFSGRDPLQMVDEIGALGDRAGPDAALGNGSEQLLGPTTPHTQQRLEAGPIDPGFSTVFQLKEGVGETVEPQGFIRHF